MNRRFATSSLVALTVLVACGAEPTRDTTTGITTAPVTTDVATVTGTGSGTDATTSAASVTGTGVTADGSSDGADSGDPKFDVPAVADVGSGTTGVPQVPCKIDFLFVIDNSTSMEDNQDELIASFPGFITAIETAVGDGTDYHVMVVDTDAQGRCQPCDPNDENYEDFCSAKNYYACSAVFEECDTVRGAGVVHPVGAHASNKKCELFGGNRYMVAEEPDLLATFKCVAAVGTAGSAAERPMNAIERALGDLNGPGECNDGFLREDAILVITFLSDDGNHADQGDPDEWKAAVVAAKGGDEDRVVVLGLIPHPELDCTNPQSDDNTQGSHWQAFIELWGEHGISGSICEANYAPFFAQAIDTIDKTCDANPPG
jgi:hypothetical protein